uniref:Uncharacterized protein n=1 Tax=Sinocyclocheilus rhinocerous TaxID=307959 RepID=A0A673HJ31_9TELE
MDGLGLALFGIFLASFAVSKPVRRLYILIFTFRLCLSIFVPLEPFVPVTGGPDAERLVAPNVTTPELQCYTVPLTSPEPKPVRGDNI